LSPTNRQIPKRYSPVRRSSACIATPVTARLACVRHAASVQSEPGSNSSLKGFETIQVTRASNELYWLIGYSPSCCASQTTDASPHTNYLFQFLKSDLHAGRRQKRNYNRHPHSVNLSNSLTGEGKGRRQSGLRPGCYRERPRSLLRGRRESTPAGCFFRNATPSARRSR
jgi:hypothetical protein